MFGKLFLMIASGLLLMFSLLIALVFGSANIGIDKVLVVIHQELFSGNMQIVDDLATHDIIWLLRAPRLLLAASIGAGLATSGVVMQAIVKNPLADPYILGISSGASVGATAAILLGVGKFLGENYVGIAAFLGALGISLSVLFIANMGGKANSTKLILAGMALSAVCSAFSSFIVYFANNAEGMQNIAYWLMGSMAGAKWSLLKTMIPLVIGGILFFWTQARILNLLLLGDECAITLGMDLHIYRQAYLIISSIIVGFSVYSAGMIGFIGLIIPHIVRMLVGTDHKYLIPISALFGAVFLLWADVFCRIIIPRAELPIGILISIIGAPCFVYLMIKKTYGFGGN